MVQNISLILPQLCWHGDTEIEICFPSQWEVIPCYMNGHQAKGLSEEAIREALANPIASRPLREIARGRKEVVIIFDDMTRSTPVAQLVPFVLEELAAAGIPDEAIRFIAATGAHGAMNRLDFEKKLGNDVLERFPVYNHNVYENCIYLGKTSRGTEVSINKEVMACDLKIGLGGIVPHGLAGFGGGAKCILPGVASIDSILANHALAIKFPGTTGSGTFENNPVRQDMNEIARMAGLDFKVDAILNLQREIVGLFAGDVIEAHKEGVKLAREHYATARPENVDTVVANFYAKADEVGLFLPGCTKLLGKEGGDLVFIVNSPTGQVPHYLNRSFGKTIGGQRWTARTSLPPGARRLIVISSFKEIAAADWLGPRDAITWTRTWDAALDKLNEAGPSARRVAVVPDMSIQYFPGK